MRRTVQIKLDIGNREAVEKTAEQFKKACQLVVDEGWNEDDLKVYNKNKLHHRTYHDIREKTDLPANLVVRARDRASDAIKGCVQRLLKEKKASKPQFTSDSIEYDKRTLSVWLDEQRCSLSTVEGRVHADFVLPDDLNDYYDRYLNDGWSVTQSTLEKHEYEDGEPYYLHLGLEKEDPDMNTALNPTVMGVDLGIDNIAVTATATFYSGDQLNHRRRRFEEIRGKLQDKGTQSAHRTIQQMSGRENRYSCDTLHRISKQIVEEAEQNDVDVIVFENLDDIRNDLPPQKQFHAWAFKKLFQFVEYKAQEYGIGVAQVNPDYTSQRCSKCGHTTSGNRDGDRFECVGCGYRLHADFNAAKNIGVRFLRNGQKSRSRTGDGQLALKSGLLKPNGDHIASPVTG